MGVRPSIVNILIEFLEDRQMTCTWNGKESSLYLLVGGGPQGSWTGQECFIVASDDNAACVEEDDRYKYSDDLSILELILLADILTEYNFMEHVASDVGMDQLYIPSHQLETQANLNRIAQWTDENLMKLKESKTNYIVFSRSRQDFAVRLTVNNKYIERQKYVKLLGVWLQEDGGWEKHIRETCKKAYARMSLLTKLKYAGVKRDDLIDIYKKFIRSVLEFCSVAMHGSLSESQSNLLEHCQAVALRIVLQSEYESYSSALILTGLQKLSQRRLIRCQDFSRKCVEHPQNKRFFPRNPSVGKITEVRDREEFVVNFARTRQYQMSAIPFCQRLLNDHHREAQGAGEGEGEAAGGLGD